MLSLLSTPQLLHALEEAAQGVCPTLTVLGTCDGRQLSS
jgi:hypothetical protein